MIIKFIEKATLTLAASANGNPVLTTAVVVLFVFMFSLLEATIEKLIFGERFEHWLDPLFMMAFISYSAYAVYMCAIHNSKTEQGQG